MIEACLCILRGRTDKPELFVVLFKTTSFYYPRRVGVNRVYYLTFQIEVNLFVSFLLFPYSFFTLLFSPWEVNDTLHTAPHCPRNHKNTPDYHCQDNCIFQYTLPFLKSP